MSWRFKGKLKSSVVQWALPDTPLRSYTKKSRWENCRKDLALRFTVVKKIYNQRFISQAILELFYLNSCIVEAKKAVREKMKETAQKRREEVVQVKRMKNPRACPHCPGFPLFQSGAEKDNHLISSHNYDYCKLCKVRLTTSPSSWISSVRQKEMEHLKMVYFQLIGPSMSVMLHSAVYHAKQLCHLCGSQSPIFDKIRKSWTLNVNNLGLFKEKLPLYDLYDD